MYITRVEITDIRCFAKIDIPFPLSDDNPSWTVIIGDNATGKSCLLRSIAIGLCDESSAAGLLKESEEGYIRRGADKGHIIVHLKDQNEPSEEYRIETTIEKVSTLSRKLEEDSIERVRQDTYPSGKPFPWGRIFACAYSAGRGTIGTGDIAGYTVINAVYNMFNYSEGLQNPELIIRRLSKKYPEKKALNILETLLPKTNKLKLKDIGITADGPWGTEMPMRDLADGYKSTFLWVTDFLGWALSYNPEITSNKEIHGIVLLDEIEQHLHPKWQRSIINDLKNPFPNVQFIITSHSSLCVIGTTDLKDEECDIILLDIIDGNITPINGKPPRGRRADQVLTSYLFGLDTTSDNKTKGEIQRYSDLLSQEHISPEDDKKIKILRKVLTNKLGSEETELENQLAAAIHETLKKMPKAKEFEKQVMDLEMKRQLRELLGVTGKS